MLSKFLNIKHKKLWLDSMVGMTWGFLATLVSGTIIGLLGMNKVDVFSKFILDTKSALFYLTPFGIGIGIGIKAKLSPLQTLALGLFAFIVGQSLFKPTYLTTIEWAPKVGIATRGPGDVFGSWIAGVVALYFFKMFQWHTFIDVILVPLTGILLGVIFSFNLTYITSLILVLTEWLIEHTINDKHWIAILLAPFLGVLMGLALSLPTSSAAIALTLKLHGDAATAAIAATSAQMLSFGVLTFLATNSWSKTLAVSFGSSMLQMRNFSQKPHLLIIPAVISGVAAIIGVALLPLNNFEAGTVTSGMGSCALYGQIFTLHENGWVNYRAWLNVLFVQLSFPILATLFIGKWALKREFIKPQDLNITYLQTSK